MKVYAATSNRAKIGELARILDGVAIVAAAPLSNTPEREPVGPTFEAVAAAKAVAGSVALRPDALVVASDGGLLVPALGEAWDSLQTRRFAGDAATDSERADALLALTADLAGADRRIGWREAVALARGGTVLAAWVAAGVAGDLARDYDRDLIATGGGFWLPAIWRCPEFDGRRLASLTTEQRATRDDHWSRLGRELRRFLSGLNESTASENHEPTTSEPAPVYDWSIQGPHSAPARP